MIKLVIINCVFFVHITYPFNLVHIMRNLNQDWIERIVDYLVGLEETKMEERETTFCDRVLKYFCLSERLGGIRGCCLRYKKILRGLNMDQEAANLAYAASVGREFKFTEAYEIIKGDV
ncbi:hypothetical protein MKW92_045961 [Papaver armeniacum]|nr:hypothetical protein MKW92_045961 [Papaver armeniacum]